MPKLAKIYVVLFILILVGFVLNDATKPKPVNWNFTFDSTDKSPFGLYVFAKELPNLFPDYPVDFYKKTPYEYLVSFDYDNVLGNANEDINVENNVSTKRNDVLETELQVDVDTLNEDYNNLIENEPEINNNPFSEIELNYMFVNQSVEIDKTSLKYLLKFVEDGNYIFLSAEDISYPLKDSLNLSIERKIVPKIESKDSLKNGILKYIEPEIKMGFYDPKLNSKSYTYSKGINLNEIVSYDTIHSQVLGYQEVEGKKYPNLIKTKYGNGYFIIHTQPIVFTNYNLLKTQNEEYVAQILSYLPNFDIVFDDTQAKLSSTSPHPLRYIFSTRELKWAWQLALFSILIFIIFRAKRRQRIIPIIEKLPNTSLDFAKTIGNLYFENGKPKDVIYKKITYFLEHIRNTYLLDTHNLNDDFIHKLASKTNIELIEIERLIKFIANLSTQREIGENNLLLLDKMIYQFYQKTQKTKKT